MDDKIERILEGIKGKKIGIFCDGANLFYASKENSWKIDLGKFKRFISQYCDLQFINYYLIIPAKNCCTRKQKAHHLHKLRKKYKLGITKMLAYLFREN